MAWGVISWITEKRKRNNEPSAKTVTDVRFKILKNAL